MPRSSTPLRIAAASASLGSGYVCAYLIFSFRPILKAPNEIGLTVRLVRPNVRRNIPYQPPKVVWRQWEYCVLSCRVGVLAHHLRRGGRVRPPYGVPPPPGVGRMPISSARPLSHLLLES